MAELNAIIPQQNFELVRVRIGQILALEIANQFTLHNDAKLNATVFDDIAIPVDISYCPAIVVSYSRTDFDNQDVRNTDGANTYNIDVFVTAETTQAERGDIKAKRILYRLLGMCRAILENPAYIRLGFSAPSIGNRRVESILINQDAQSGDAKTVAHGRIVFNVRVPEDVQLKDATDWAGTDTIMTIEETDIGYKYTLNA